MSWTIKPISAICHELCRKPRQMRTHSLSGLGQAGRCGHAASGKLDEEGDTVTGEEDSSNESSSQQ